ncbi:MAG: hypothetical protein KA072_13090 [Thermoanaerobaculaceae bacterium]|nr:hypothetical protein [Thermoanaerobaculaceae bacterium]MDI9622922.1 hypothetical protein [Acidobacteriota bacterium]NLH09954.1 hypothetical protein [Holophagae bacterium]HPW56499.1 hypothetical protein [Thermoanaerobaculaceae bacterium]
MSERRDPRRGRWVRVALFAFGRCLIVALAGVGLLLSIVGRPVAFYIPFDNGPDEPNNMLVFLPLVRPQQQWALAELERAVFYETGRIRSRRIRYPNRFWLTARKAIRIHQGECFERTTIALDMALRHGFDAEPKLVTIDDGKEERFHALLTVRTGERVLYLEPSRGVVASSPQGYFEFLRRHGEADLRAIRIFPFEKRSLPKLIFTARGEREEERDRLRPEAVVTAAEGAS